MSKYTTTVRFICEQAAGLTESGGFNDVLQILTDASPNVFNFVYPFWGSETQRRQFERKFLMHYYDYEIGLETVGLWKQKLQSKLYDIMPYYIELFKTTQEKFGIFDNVDYTITHEQTDDKTIHSETDIDTHNTSGNSGQSTISDTNRRLFQDTPQGSLTNLENEKYLTNATKVTDNQNIQYQDSGNVTGQQSTVGNGSDKLEREFTTTKKGTESGTSKAKLLTEFRNTIINIELQIIEECSDLFMMIF